MNNKEVNKSNKFPYLPNKEVLLNWFNKEYRECIEHDITKNSEFFDSMKELDKRAKESCIEYMAIELFYKNNSTGYINNHGDYEVYELKSIIAKILEIDEIDTKDPNVSISIMNQKEFLQMVNTVNHNFREHAYHLKLLIYDSTFIKLELFDNEEYSPIHFLDKDFHDISLHYMPTNFVKYLTNIYGSKVYKN